MALIHRWPLTANANDVVGSWHMTNVGGVTFSQEGGAEFSGSNNLNIASITLPTVFSMTAWVKLKTAGSTQYNSVCGMASGAGLSYVPYGTSYVRHQCCGIEVSSTGVPFVDDWFMIGMGTNGSNLTTKYFNGTYQSTTSVGATRTFANWQIGRGFWATNTYLDGYVVDFRIHGTNLSQSEYDALKEAGPNVMWAGAGSAPPLNKAVLLSMAPTAMQIGGRGA